MPGRDCTRKESIREYEPPLSFLKSGHYVIPNIDGREVVELLRVHEVIVVSLATTKK